MELQGVGGVGGQASPLNCRGLLDHTPAPQGRRRQSSAGPPEAYIFLGGS
jgi:hypothetical protein